MSSRGGPRGRGKDGDRGRGGGYRGGRGGGQGATMELPIRESQGQGRGRGRGRGFDGSDRGRGGFFRGGPRGGGGGGGGPRIYAPSGPLTPPNPEVQKIENSVAAAIAKKPRKITSYPERPGYGTQGQAVTLFANYFDFKVNCKELFCYSIDIDPGTAKKPGARKSKQIIRLLFEEHLAQYESNITSDWRSTVVSNVKILPSDKEPSIYDVRYREDNDDEYPERPTVHRVQCQYTKTLTPSQLLSYLTSTNAEAFFDAKPEVLRAMDIVLGFYAKTQQSVASVGSNRHFAVSGPLVEKWNLGAGLEAYRGFFVSIRAATARLLVNVQVKYSACYQEGSLADVVREFQRTHRNVYDLRRFLDKLRVRVTHIARKNKQGQVIPRIKAITGLAAQNDGKRLPKPPRVKHTGAGPNDVEFFLNAPAQQPPPQGPSGSGSKKGKKPAKAGPAPAGKYISVADFFHQQYRMDLDPRLPVVNVGTRDNPSYLPVEVCMVEPGQPAKAKLSPNQTRNMLNFAVRTPAQNAQSIVSTGLRVLGLAPPNSTLDEFGMELDPGLITVPGRVLPAPSVYYKDAKQSRKQVKPQSGSWNMKSIRFEQPTKLVSWTWLLIDVEGARPFFSSPQDLIQPLKSFAAKLNEIGVNINPPHPGRRILVNRDDDFEAVIDQAVCELVSKQQPKLIMGILPFNDAGYYSAVKRACDIKYGVLNINVLAERLRTANDQYIANVGLKFNLKLGGVNQTLDRKELGIIGEGKTMLAGIDVTHPSPGSSPDAPSIAAVVASTDATLGQWPAQLRIQKSRQEMVSDLDAMLQTPLKNWVTSHKRYPENLIIYRDGVSESQYETVLEKELPLVKKACAAVYPASDTKQGLPRIAIMCVGKRHHTRFYPTRDQDADRSANPSNGTVVDRGVTEARNWDFYLQAHTALKGTARPAHYFTLWDEIFHRQKPAPPHQNAADALEALTHHLCYLFGRATKAVSICPPAYYADLVCTRARCYLSKMYDPSTASSVGSVAESKPEAMTVTVHPNVKNTMFYI
ncbi:ribonuclease H-like domain-containing protein [Aspergillus ambiguus]|uniref:putative RNA interference and gene silencing protein (Qde2) n=1 Tax=Aspergillus ambiguus TaxID=176160 RepID=UPI003CCDC22C